MVGNPLPLMTCYRGTRKPTILSVARVAVRCTGMSKGEVVAGELQRFKAEFFRVLAHPVRIKLLEVLLEGERSVQELQDILGLDQPVVSQQLAILRSKTIVTRRKAGTSVRYSVRDPLVGDLLAVARRIFNNHLVGTQGLLRELQRQGRVRQARLQ